MQQGTYLILTSFNPYIELKIINLTSMYGVTIHVLDGHT
jgi:hypothetical protein